MPSSMNSCEAPVQCTSVSINGLDDQDFPALPKPKQPCPIIRLESLVPSYQLKVTEVVEIPCEERRYQGLDSELTTGKRYGAQSKVCMEIAREHGVEINLNTSKTLTLTAIISGEPNKVAQAKRSVICELQQQETLKLKVPVEYHGYLIGRKGERLRELQFSTMTRINIPPTNAPDPNVITITGPRRGINEAQQLILAAVQKQSEQGFERLNIPKIYHPFVCGPNNEYVNALKTRTGTKINVPPPAVPDCNITISGKREGVLLAAQDIQALHNELVETTKTIPVHVKKSQHRIVFGPRGSGLTEILAQTGVSVELPTDPMSEEIILRGRPEHLGRALSMVYERAGSSVIEELKAPNRFHGLLIGKRGAKLAEILEGYERVQLDFGDNTDKITIEGPPEEVAVVMNRLKERLAELEATIARITMKVNPKYYRRIIGKQGATIDRLREYKVQIRLPSVDRNDSLAPDEITIEGDPEGVEKAKHEIEQLVKKLENEKCKDVIIEPFIQHILCSGQPQPIRLIYDNFPKVSIIWPEPDTLNFNQDSPSNSVVQLRGDRQQVDAAAERLHKLVKTTIEENFRQEIRIFKEFHPHIFNRESTKIRNLLEETKTRLQHPNSGENSELFTVIGREENVRLAIQRLEKLQKDMANIKEITVSIPSALTTSFAGTQAPSLRSIREQCEGVHIRFLNSHAKNPGVGGNKLASRKTNEMEILVLGPEEAVNKAQALLEELNSKVSELCAEEIVYADPKYHGFLIGRHACHIIDFRNRHHVELLFPDRMHPANSVDSGIRIVGTKECVASAKRELESIIKTLEDEVEYPFQVDTSLLKDIVLYRRVFSYPDLEHVRLIWPKNFGQNKDLSYEANEALEGNTGTIKLIGNKACVEAAVQALDSMIKDIREKTTQIFPLTDLSQVIALDRSRSIFPELKRSYKVFIRLTRASDYSTSEKIGDSASKDAEVIATLVITGRPEHITSVFEERIKPLLPIEEEVPLAQEFHRDLIVLPSECFQSRDQARRVTRDKAKSGTNDDINFTPTSPEATSKANELRQKFGVIVRLLPKNAKDPNFIILRGTPDQLSAAKADLTEWLHQCEVRKADRIARSYELAVNVPMRYVQPLLAMRSKLCATYEIGMRLSQPRIDPRISSSEIAHTINGNRPEEQQCSTLNGQIESEVCSTYEASSPTKTDNEVVSSTEKMGTIILRGYQEKVSAAKRELDEVIKKLAAEVTEDLYIPAEVHPHLIGAGGNAVQKTMRDYHVRIEFPNRSISTVDPNTVLVTGDQKNVDLACDYLIAKANEWIVRLQPQGHHTRSRLVEEEILPSGQTIANIIH